MPHRLLLIRHGETEATVAGAFPGDEGLTAAAEARARDLAAAIPGLEAEALCSPALRCRQTAAAAGLQPRVEPRIVECDFGRWIGRTLADVHAADPDAAIGWMRDPSLAPHGGESLTALLDRVGGWLDALAAGIDHAAGAGATTVAVTHGGVIRAAVTHVLGAPAAAMYRIQARPLSLTELVGYDAGWTLERVNATVTADGQAR